MGCVATEDTSAVYGRQVSNPRQSLRARRGLTPLETSLQPPSNMGYVAGSTLPSGTTSFVQAAPLTPMTPSFMNARTPPARPSARNECRSRSHALYEENKLYTREKPKTMAHFTDLSNYLGPRSSRSQHFHMPTTANTTPCVQINTMGDIYGWEASLEQRNRQLGEKAVCYDTHSCSNQSPPSRMDKRGLLSRVLQIPANRRISSSP